MNRPILVTGGSGFIGRRVVDKLLVRGQAVVDVDCLTYAGDPEANLGSTRVVEDIAKLHSGKLEKYGPFSGLIHLAAESHVDNSLTGPSRFIETNVLGTLNVLEIARHFDVPHAVIMSSDEVTGSLGRYDLKTDESSQIRPSSPYSASKAAAELLALSYYRSYGLHVAIARSVNCFGPHQHPEKFIPRLITYMLKGRPGPLYAAGGHIRDWIHVDDAAEGILCVFDRGRAGEVYTIGANHEQENRDIAALVAKMLDGRVESVEDRPGHDLRYASDTAKMENELGWSALVPWAKGLIDTVEWYKSHPDWWNSAIERGGRW